MFSLCLSTVQEQECTKIGIFGKRAAMSASMICKLLSGGRGKERTGKSIKKILVGFLSKNTLEGSVSEYIFVCKKNICHDKKRQTEPYLSGRFFYI